VANAGGSSEGEKKGRWKEREVERRTRNKCTVDRDGRALVCKAVEPVVI